MLWDPAQTEKLVLLSDESSLTVQEIADQLGKSRKAVVAKRHALRAKGIIRKRDAVSNWWDANTDKLVRLYETGMPAGEIAKALGKSRNAVIGKIHRLQRQGILPAHTPPPKKPRKPRIRKKSSKAKVVQHVTKPLNGNSQPMSATSQQIACPIDLLGLGEDNCRWPIGDPQAEGFHFCGALVVEGRPYCPGHCGIAYVKTERQLQREIRQ